MTWQVIFDDRARKELRKLAPQQQDRILNWIRDNFATKNDPKRIGKPLKGRFKNLWRYRVSDFRIISRINGEKIEILIIRIGHRRDIYE